MFLTFKALNDKVRRNPDHRGQVNFWREGETLPQSKFWPARGKEPPRPCMGSSLNSHAINFNFDSDNINF